MAKKKQKKLKKSILFKSWSILLMMISVISLVLFHFIGILPWKYFFLLFAILAVLNFFFYRFLVSKNWKKRLGGFIGSFILMIVLVIGIFYQSVTLDFLGNAFKEKETIENYQVLVLKSSNYGSLKEMKNGKIGLPKSNLSEGAKKIQNEIKKKTSLTITEEDNGSLVKSLLNKNLKVIVMEEAQKNLFLEINESFKDNVKVLENIPITIENKKPKKDGTLTKKPFNIYIAGNDDYGIVNQVSRSDVNMIITVNPNTHKVLLTSVPRDYYVDMQIDSEGIVKDKLTHVSLYGIDTSMETLEKLFDTKIDYYLKINFSSLIKLVDAVDGIDVNNNKSFTAYFFDEPNEKWIYQYFPEGLNHLNGTQALAFARERHSLVLGDRERALHQQMVLKALIEKVISPSILTKYPSLLKALNGSFDTNLNYDDIMSFLQKQLDDNPSWEILNQVLEGSDSYGPVYSIPKAKPYVMIPDGNSVRKAKESISNIINNS